ncbi:hypothetical protein [Robiginitalea aurantiaca]|uniref:Uncharacterized protein n=1 Tax=Robiginitalea aurantiaca TaxID=3056915 RepID=A0ABT7WBE5_9FLAO|nr:hypothetical protein [Robiginitalea aurantiaca]MDM9630245.1 hypothetical protein [Robiginitalea aurantiaca]
MRNSLEFNKYEYQDSIHELVIKKMRGIDENGNLFDRYLKSNYIDGVLKEGKKYSDYLILRSTGIFMVDGGAVEEIFNMDIPYWEKKVRTLIHGYKELCLGVLGGIAMRSIFWDLCVANFIRREFDLNRSVVEGTVGYDKFLEYVESTEDWDQYKEYDILPNGYEETVVGAIHLLRIQKSQSWMAVVIASSLKMLIQNILEETRYYKEDASWIFDYKKFKEELKDEDYW